MVLILRAIGEYSMTHDDLCVLKSRRVRTGFGIVEKFVVIILMFKARKNFGICLFWNSFDKSHFRSIKTACAFVRS